MDNAPLVPADDLKEHEAKVELAAVISLLAENTQPEKLLALVVIVVALDNVMSVNVVTGLNTTSPAPINTRPEKSYDAKAELFV